MASIFMKRAMRDNLSHRRIDVMASYIWQLKTNYKQMKYYISKT
jgi:hypothetical protein